MDERDWTSQTDYVHVGDILNCKIAIIFQSGLYVDIGAPVLGLIHLRSMSNEIKDRFLSNLLAVGDELQAVVIGIDDVGHRIAMGCTPRDFCLKELWNEFIRDNDVIGRIFSGSVVYVAPHYINIQTSLPFDCVLMRELDEVGQYPPLSIGKSVAVKIASYDYRNLRFIVEIVG